MRPRRPVVRFHEVSKSFAVHRGHMLIREHLAAIWKGTHGQKFQALKNVSLEVMEGESLAIVGSNGAGKSTLLGLMAGLTRPDRGRVEVKGRIAALLELGSGFDPDLTGRENVNLNAALLGFSRKKAAECLDAILEFAGIGDFIDEPLRTYSSGMVMRLAFAVSVNVDPDILLIDEVLTVGDAAFQAKSAAKIREFRDAGKSLVCVSHDEASLLELCDRAVWLDHHEIAMTGTVASVLAAYHGAPAAVDAVSRN